jgi:hypothetical protein
VKELTIMADGGRIQMEIDGVAKVDAGTGMQRTDSWEVGFG